jgi:hypothetical protein
MTLADWEARGWLQKSKIQKDNILELLQSAEADLIDARRDVSPEWSFSLACTSALNLCAVLLYGSGYHADQDAQLKAIRALPAILGFERGNDAKYLEDCLTLHQQKRIEQEQPISPRQASSLIKFTEDFYLEVIDWLRTWDPPLVANSDISIVRQEHGPLIL